MLRDIIIRFLLGGAIVSAFAAIGEIWKPKTYAGVFGAAPSVAIASLALAFGKTGAADVAIRARWMALGAVALLAYCQACVVLSQRTRVPEWVGAGAAWALWIAIALAIWAVAA